MNYINKAKENKIFRQVFPYIIILFCVVLTELFIFNFRHWQFINNEQTEISDWKMSDNLIFADYNAFTVGNLEKTPYIEASNINMPVNLVYTDFVNMEKGEFGVIEIKYHFEMNDEGNAILYDLPTQTFFRMITKTHYSSLNPYGYVKNLRICFDNLNEGDTIRVNSFVLNPKYPFQISKKRIMFLFILISLLYLLRPSSTIYSIKVIDKFKGKKIIITAVLFAEILLFFVVTRLDKYYENINAGAETQFMMLTEAIIDRGEFFLNVNAPDELKNMDDPYDAKLRLNTAGELADGMDMSDTGFYKENGKYFVYFGVGPILLFYVPKYVLTGAHAVTRDVVFILTALISGTVMFLLYEIAKRYFKSMPYAVYLMFSVLFSFGGGQLFLSITPDFYAVPILSGLLFSMLGLAFVIKSVNDEGKALLFFLGGLCLAFVAACRPQFLIVSFMTLPILIPYVVTKSKNQNGIKKVLLQGIAFVVPYIIVASLVMYYNYARFSNVFDFGANYNLTYNNMPFRGFHIDRLLHPLIGYLFYPCSVVNEFPYFQVSNYISRYQGITADENLFGGVIYNNIYLITILLVIPFRKIIKNKEAFMLAVLGPVFAIIVGVVDANMAGTLPRYYADFTWGHMIAAFIFIGYAFVFDGTVSGRKSEKITVLSKEVCLFINKSMCYLFYICFVVSIVRMFLMVFYGNAVKDTNLYVFNEIKNLVEFWN